MKKFAAIFFLCWLSLRGAIPNGYRVDRSFALPSGTGCVELLLDQAISETEIKEHWGTGQWDGSEPKNALIRLVTRQGEVKTCINLERPLAKIDCEGNVPHEPPRVTVDFSADFGSYSGPVTRWLIAMEDRLVWAQAQNQDGSKTEVSVCDTLKTAWKRRSRTDGGLDVYQIACRPTFETDSHGMELFSLKFSHFYFDGKNWTHAFRTKLGFWENEAGAFPGESSFP